MNGMHLNSLFRVLTLLIFCLALLNIFPNMVCANPPKEIKLSFDASSRTLKAAITHSPFSSGHYIEKAEVKKNGQTAAVQDFKIQPSETFTYTVKIDAVPGDVLEVKASCSRFGSRTEKLTVGPPAAK